MRRKTTKKGRRKTSKQNIGIYKGIPYDSLEELYFFHWCFELKDKGYIKSIVRAEPYSLSDSVTNNYIKRLKTKSKPMSQKIMEGHVYTPEVKIVWGKPLPIIWEYGTPIKRDKDQLFVAHREGNELYSIVEIKPMHDFKNMERLARLNIKWVFQRYTQWVNLIKNEILFEETFTPLSYLKTPTGKSRKIKWKPKMVDKYVRELHDMEDIKNKMLAKAASFSKCEAV